VPIFWSVSERQLVSRCESEVQGNGEGSPPGILSVSFKLYLRGSTHNKLVSRSFSALLLQWCTVRDRNYDGRSWTTTYNVISFIRVVVAILRWWHGQHVKDVRPATRRCARRARLSFLKVPSFCPSGSPGHMTHVNNVVPEGERDVAYLHLINSQLMPWASAEVSARGSGPVRTCIRPPVS